MNEGILERIKVLANELAKRFLIESIVLFGSFVEGKPEPNDIDIFLYKKVRGGQRFFR